ncbi:MAG: hypothetical protein M3329_07350 [Pseudomonadota bacterium]|nr:hypothetical protein [Pseudomonadota bacterium]
MVDLGDDAVNNLGDDFGMILRSEVPTLEDVLEPGVEIARKAKFVRNGQ